MWYRFIKKSGAANVLRGYMEFKGTIKDSVSKYSNVFSVEDLPSHQSIIDFIYNKSLPYLQKLSQSNITTARDEIIQLTNFIHHVIELYLRNPKYKHLVYQLYQSLSKAYDFIKILYPEYNNLYVKRLLMPEFADSSYWLNDILQIGYGTLIDLDQAGVYISPNIKFAILAGLDIKSKPSLAKDPLRKKFIEYILNKYPFYQKFLIINGNDNNIKKFIYDAIRDPDDLFDELQGSLLPFEIKSNIITKQPDKDNTILSLFQNIFLYSGLPSNDIVEYIKVASMAPSDNAIYKTEMIFALLKTLFYNTEKSNIVYELLFNYIKNNIPEENLADLFTRWIEYSYKYISESVIDKIRHNEVAMGIINNTLVKTRPLIIIQMGLAPFDLMVEYAAKNPRIVDAIIGLSEEEKNKIKKAALSKQTEYRMQSMKHENQLMIMEKGIKNQDELVEEYRKMRERQRISISESMRQKGYSEQQIQDFIEKHKREDDKVIKQSIEMGINPDQLSNFTTSVSPMQYYINNNEIIHDTLDKIEDGKYLTTALLIGKAMGLSPEIIKKWASMIHVYWIKTPNFEQFLNQSGNPSYDTLRDTSFLGGFTPFFSHDEQPENRMPSIIINEYKIIQQYQEMPLLKTLNVSIQTSIDATMSHEIGHALNYIATGGKFLDLTHVYPREKPDLTPEENKARHRQRRKEDVGRKYITDYPEIVARVYGAMPIWKKTIYERIHSLRSSDIIKKAVEEEMLENIMMHPAYLTIGGRYHPVEEYKRMEKREPPYDITPNPLEAANKRIQRETERARDILRQIAQKHRRDILLNIIKQINGYKKQLEMIEHANATIGNENKYETEFIQSEINTLKNMEKEVLNGGYDYEIDSSVESVIFNFTIRELETMAKVVSDPEWKPPFTLVGTEPPENIYDAYAQDPPISYKELQEISQMDKELSQPEKNKPNDLGQPKQIGIIIPPFIVGPKEGGKGYKKIFYEDILPQYEKTEKTSPEENSDQ